ncbi:MAG: 1,4-D-glucanase, partial [Nevskia sp.]|nr:1,4-D-glucanase [Nevskia sp.]
RKDLKSDGRGSYDAVRCYLWAGISPSDSAATHRWREVLAPFADFIRKAGRLPEVWYPDGRAPQGLAPAGIEAALLPFYATLPAKDLLELAQKRLLAATTMGLVDQPARYYEQALTLFGQGWIEHRYRFEADGKLRPQWIV